MTIARILTTTALLAVTGAACQLNGDAATGDAQEPAARGALAEGAVGQPVCQVARDGRSLPADVRESSGLAQSRRDPSIFWTHNDAGGDPTIFAVDQEGSLRGRVRVTGAELQDWEDIAAGPCASGECLFIGDIGDNDGERDLITIYRIEEPEVGSGDSVRATAIRARFPDGRYDAEALFVLPDGAMYLVTKGREGPIALYRFPTTAGADGAVTLERVRELFPEAAANDDRVTGAAASPDGRWVGIRTYRTLHLYPAADLVGGGSAASTRIDLRPLGEPQGESLSIANDGTIWLTSESAGGGEPPRLSRIRCELPA